MVKTGKKVAVVGSGPAGLAAAAQLSKAGHSVTVYERDDRPGGLLRYGIPDFKLEKWVVERRIDIMQKDGVVFQCNTEVGKDIAADEIVRTNDAVVLAGGSTIPRNLPIPGRELKGIHFAMDFLKQQNKRVSDIKVEGEDIVANGQGCNSNRRRRYRLRLCRYFQPSGRKLYQTIRGNDAAARAAHHPCHGQPIP